MTEPSGPAPAEATQQAADSQDAQYVSVPRIATVAELAEILHVSTRQVYDLRTNGLWPDCFRVGKELRFDLGYLPTYLAAAKAALAVKDEGRQASRSQTPEQTRTAPPVRRGRRRQSTWNAA